MITIATISMTTSGSRSPKVSGAVNLKRIVNFVRFSSLLKKKRIGSSDVRLSRNLILTIKGALGLKLSKFGSTKLTQNQLVSYSYPQSNAISFSGKGTGLKLSRLSTSSFLFKRKAKLLTATGLKLKKLGATKFIQNQLVAYSYPQSNVISFSGKTTGLKLKKLGATKFIQNQLVDYSYPQSNVFSFSGKTTGLKLSKLSSTRLLFKLTTMYVKTTGLKLSKFSSSLKKTTVLYAGDAGYLHTNAVQLSRLRFTSLNYAPNRGEQNAIIQFWS